MIFQQLVDRISLNPKRLFWVDAFGAILSAFLLGVVLVKLESVFGIPAKTLYFLAFLPAVFVLYDFYCLIRVKENIGLFLKGIAYINLVYCCISFGLAFYHYKKITYMGWSYVLLEICILIALASLEFRTAELTSKNNIVSI